MCASLRLQQLCSLSLAEARVEIYLPGWDFRKDSCALVRVGSDGLVLETRTLFYFHVAKLTACIVGSSYFLMASLHSIF